MIQRRHSPRLVSRARYLAQNYPLAGERGNFISAGVDYGRWHRVDRAKSSLSGRERAAIARLGNHTKSARTLTIRFMSG
jgi:hypothetical protein